MSLDKTVGTDSDMWKNTKAIGHLAMEQAQKFANASIFNPVSVSAGLFTASYYNYLGAAKYIPNIPGVSAAASYAGTTAYSGVTWAGQLAASTTAGYIPANVMWAAGALGWVALGAVGLSAAKAVGLSVYQGLASHYIDKDGNFKITKVLQEDFGTQSALWKCTSTLLVATVVGASVWFAASYFTSHAVYAGVVAGLGAMAALSQFGEKIPVVGEYLKNDYLTVGGLKSGICQAALSVWSNFNLKQDYQDLMSYVCNALLCISTAGAKGVPTQTSKELLETKILTACTELNYMSQKVDLKRDSIANLLSYLSQDDRNAIILKMNPIIGQDFCELIDEKVSEIAR